MLRGSVRTNGVCMLRHCYLGDCIQPVFFSLSLVRDKKGIPAYFVCNILPMLACTCTDTSRDKRYRRGVDVMCSRKCTGLLKGQGDKLYQISNPADLFPWCPQPVDLSTGAPIQQSYDGHVFI